MLNLRSVFGLGLALLASAVSRADDLPAKGSCGWDLVAHESYLQHSVNELAQLRRQRPLEFIPIESGSFVDGANLLGIGPSGSELPPNTAAQWTVRITVPFGIMNFPVDQVLYALVMESNPAADAVVSRLNPRWEAFQSLSDHEKEYLYYRTGRYIPKHFPLTSVNVRGTQVQVVLNHPVFHVSGFQAQEFVRRLNLLVHGGDPLVLAYLGLDQEQAQRYEYRLISREQFDYIVRTGTVPASTAEKRYRVSPTPWTQSDSPNPLGLFEPLLIKLPNGGTAAIHDLSGNVRTWTDGEQRGDEKFYQWFTDQWFLRERELGSQTGSPGVVPYRDTSRQTAVWLGERSNLPTFDDFELARARQVHGVNGRWLVVGTPYFINLEGACHGHVSGGMDGDPFVMAEMIQYSLLASTSVSSGDHVSDADGIRIVRVLRTPGDSPTEENLDQRKAPQELGEGGLRSVDHAFKEAQKKKAAE